MAKLIREWDYDGPGLDVTVERHSVSIRQFDGYGEMKLAVTSAEQARALIASLEAFASKDEGARIVLDVRLAARGLALKRSAK